MISQKVKPFKETYTKQKRNQMREQAKKGHIVVVIEKDQKCKALPDLKHNRFSIAQDQKVMQVCNAIRSRIIAIDQKYKNQPFFLFTNKILPNKEYSVKDIYQTQKDPEDGLLYFKYSNVDPF